MSELVNADQIEQIVGADRHPVHHLARSVTAEQKVYILHSRKCRARMVDLRACPYSLALDGGIDPDDWRGFEDRPVVVTILHGRRLFPLVPKWLTSEGE